MISPVAWLWVFLLMSPNEPSDQWSRQDVNKVVAAAQSFIGTPYYWGGNNEDGLDCSGLMVLCFRAANIELPRHSGDQAQRGFPIGRQEIQRGDLVFFEKKGKVGHVGLVMHTEGREVWFIHSSSSQGVIVSRLSEPYWKKRYHSTRRMWGTPRTAPEQPLTRGPVAYRPIPNSSKLLAGPPLPELDTPPGFEASLRKLSSEEVTQMSEKDRIKTQAFILAHHGWQFEQAEIRAYFEGMPWYQALPQITDPETILDRLSPVEKYNIRLLNR